MNFLFELGLEELPARYVDITSNELKNKVVNAPHVNMFKVASWTTMGVFATYLLIYVFAGEEMLKYYPLLIVFAFGAPLVSLMTSKASVKRAYNIRMIDNGGARTEKEQLVVDTVTLLSEKLNLQMHKITPIKLSPRQEKSQPKS